MTDDTKLSPEVRFPEFSDEWEIKDFYDTLTQVLDFRGRTPLKLGMEWGGDIPSLSALNVKMGYVDLTIDPHFGSEELYRKWMINGDLSKNDIIFTMEAPLGNVALVPDDRKYILSQRVVVFKTKSSYDNKFLYQLISAPKFQGAIEKLGTGSTAKGINQRSLQKVKIEVPSKPEQMKIAEFLMSVDELITKSKRRIELLKQYKKGVMQKIFSQQVRFKNENGEYYPQWREDSAGTLFKNVSNRQHVGELPVLSVTQDNGIARRDSLDRKINQSDEGIRNYKIIEPDDFVISLRSFQGGIEKSDILGISSPAYTVIRGGSKVLPEFFKHLFKRQEFISMLNSTVVGIRDGKQISYVPFSTLKLPTPSIDEQKKIASFLTTLDSRIKTEQALLASAKQWKKGLSRRMFI